MGTITSANNGTNVPSDEGFNPGGNFILTVQAGSTIAAVLQKYDAEADSWYPVIDPDSLQVIDANWSHPITAARSDRFRIAVTTATGTWYYHYKTIDSKTFI